MSTEKPKKDASFLPRAWGAAGQRKKDRRRESVDSTDAKSPEENISSDSIEEELSAQCDCPSKCCEAPEDRSHTSESHEPISEDPLGDDAPDIIDEALGQPGHALRAKTNVRVVGIRFGYACKIYHFDAMDMDLAVGDWVVVKTEKGLGLGLVALGPFERQLDAAQLEGLRKVLKKATDDDFDQKGRCRSKRAGSLRVLP